MTPDELIRSADRVCRSIAHATARRFREQGHAADFGDAYSGALIGAWKAAQSYDPAKGAAFTTWAYGYAKRYAVVECNRAAGLTASRGDGLMNVYSLEDAVQRGADDEDSERDPIDPAAPSGELLVAGVAVREAVAALPDDQREIVFLTYWRGLGPTEVGKRVGLSKSGVRYVLDRAHAALRVSLAVFA